MSFLKALLTLAVALLPAVASAAGLGKLIVKSALGEPLLAEIELVNVQKDELVTLNAKLASREAFTQARLEFLPVFSTFKFSIELRGDVTPYIKITSGQPVNDPFVDMLVELTWSSGKLLREYTFLLDPPGAAAPPAPAAEAAPVPPVAAPIPAPAPAVRAPKTVPAPAVVAPEAAPAKKPAVREPGPKAEGWVVQRGDTLSKVAQATRPQGVSLNQMLVALYRANPEAFSGKNMNRLKTGPILRIPEAKEIEAVPSRDANVEVKAQVSDWNDYRQRLAGAAVPVAGSEAKPEAAGKVTTKVEETVPAAGDKKEVLKLSKGQPPAGAGDQASLQSRVQSLQEEAIAKDKALAEANERVAQLEKNIKEMQKLLELKGVAAPARPEAATPEAPKAAQAPQPEAAKPAETPAAAEAPKPEAPKAADAPKPAPPKPAPPKAPPAPEPSFFEGPMGAAVGGLLVLLLGALGYMAYQRRRAAAPAAAAPAAPAASFEPAFAEGEAKPAAGAGEEVDSLAEAEVYLAYGRDAQAEEILKEAISRQPGRTEIHHKLLEIYSKRGDKRAFEQTARVLQGLGVAGAAWESVQAMGLALDPGNPLYGGAPAPEPVAPTAAAGIAAGLGGVPAPATAKEEPVALDFDLDSIVAATPAAQPAAPAAESQSLASTDLVFDVTAPEPEDTYPLGEKKVDVPLSAGGEPRSLDLSLPSIDLEIPGAGTATPSVSRDAHWQEVATKFDLAKVYKEMGDKDGAREILQEVMREGDAQQQEEAKALLATL